MTNLSLWVLLLPLLGFIVLGLAGRYLPRTAILAIGWGACGLSFLLAAVNFFSMLATPAANRVSDVVVFPWLTAGSFSLSFGQLLDPLTMTMLLVVTGVGLLIHIYAAGYMAEDPGFWRFFAYLNFFIFAMLLLVTANNFLFLLVGWGLVGLASFLLIGFWYQRPAAVAAARKAFVINVIGDFGLMLAIFLLFVQFGRLDYSGVLGGAAKLSTESATAICILLFVACAAKSAQIPLYMWLPDAMEGPTPVSALIHAATMVTAGVYLVARAYPLFELAPLALALVAALGGATALFAALIALTQLDIKRVLAYSTISQLGYMFMAEGVHNYSAGIFHLVTHAFFKALLFLGAGAVIHALAGEQDLRKMGGLWGRIRVTAITFLIAALAISGVPPLAGFWSKDEILASLLAEATTTGNAGFYVLWGVGLLTAGLTAFYMFRLFFGIFSGSYRGETARVFHANGNGDDENGNGHTGGVSHSGIHDVSPVMSGPLIVLAFLSVVGGFLGPLGLIGLESWQPLFNFLPAGLHEHAAEITLSIEWTSTILSLVAAALGIGLAWRLYGKGFAYKESKNPLYQLSLHKFYVDEALDMVLVRPILFLSRGFSRFLEGVALDGGSRGVAIAFQGLGGAFRRVQTGYMRNYALGIMLGVVLIVVYYAVRG